MTTTGAAGLFDSFGRVHEDLRVSLTDKCNLRCTYCMPAEGLAWLPKDELLTDDEMVRVIAVAVGLGIRDVRFTGGEPLLRPGLIDIVTRVGQLSARPQMSVTTNGLGLAKLAPALARAGLDRVNVSLDTVNRETFATLTRRDRFDDVIEGMAAAAAAGLVPVKVNSVLMRGVNDHEAPALLEFCLAHGYQLRIIEQMPLDAQHGWDRSTMVTADEVLVSLRDAGFEIEENPAAQRGSQPAEEFLVGGYTDALGRPATVGIIASVTRPFCGACDRVRLTADGQVRNCLFARDEDDLRAALRSGVDDAALSEIFRRSIGAKLPGHGINDVGFLQPPRPMSAIGG